MRHIQMVRWSFVATTFLVTTYTACGAFKAINSDVPVSEEDKFQSSDSGGNSLMGAEIEILKVENFGPQSARAFVLIRNIGSETWNDGRRGRNVDVRFNCNGKHQDIQVPPSEFKKGATAGLTSHYFSCSPGSTISAYAFNSDWYGNLVETFKTVPELPPTPFALSVRFVNGSCNITSNGNAIGAVSTVSKDDQIRISGCTPNAGFVNPPTFQAPCIGGNNPFKISQDTNCNVTFAAANAPPSPPTPPAPGPTAAPAPAPAPAPGPMTRRGRIGGYTHLEASAFDGANTQGRLDIINEGTVTWTNSNVRCFNAGNQVNVSFSGASGAGGSWAPGQVRAIVVNVSGARHAGSSGEGRTAIYRCILQADQEDLSESGDITFTLINR